MSWRTPPDSPPSTRFAELAMVAAFILCVIGFILS